MIELTQDLLDKASTVSAMADNNDTSFAVALLVDWVKQDPEQAVRVMLVLAVFEQRLKDAHAAYNAGDRDDVTVELERRYSSIAKAKNRAYRARKQPRKAI